MWLIFGIGAIIFAALNLIWSFRGKTSKVFGFTSLSLTALTVCAIYADAAMRVVTEDWTGILDIMPTMSKTLWICVIISVLVNSISLFGEKK